MPRYSAAWHHQLRETLQDLALSLLPVLFGYHVADAEQRTVRNLSAASSLRAQELTLRLTVAQHPQLLRHQWTAEKKGQAGCCCVAGDAMPLLPPFVC
jgi:hypothetical protein